MNPELNAKIQLLRQKAREGTLTQDELKEAIVMLREGRTQAAKTSATSRAGKAAGKAKANINSDDLLSELDGLG